MTTSLPGGPLESMWPQIVFHTGVEQAPVLEEALFACEALSVIYQDNEDQPVLEPAPGEIRLWDNIRLIGLFSQEQNLDDIIARLTLALDGPLPEHQWVPLPDQQWERAWMDAFQPMQFGPGLWICPTHCEPLDPLAVNVRLDPGLAFGTGTHATTRQCLQWLGTNDVSEKCVLDYGCGSGVLAVAAALLGAREVVAVDIDPQAIEATRINAASNAVLERIVSGLPHQVIPETTDIILANILFRPLMELAPEFARILRPGGALILSGLLDEQAEEIVLRYNQWFTFLAHGQQDGWALLHASRLSGPGHG